MNVSRMCVERQVRARDGSSGASVYIEKLLFRREGLFSTQL